MLKIICRLLYGLAITTGVAGLFAGGVPLAKFALQYLRDHEYGYYYDTNSLYLPEIVFLLSLSLLIFVHIGLMVGKRIQPASPPKPDSPAPTDEISQPAGTAGTPAQTGQETADEKLARLLNQKKD
jgi:hypothetical protein